MCNAQNHSFDCPCGFGGDTGGGGRARTRTGFVSSLERYSAGWAEDSGGTVESYVNPNAHCPVCQAPVFFYRSPYNGRVFFDRLGWPWPKHGCTDNRLEPRRITRDSTSSIPGIEPEWRIQGWQPLVSARVYSSGDRLQITGDFQDEFLELYLSTGQSADCAGPIFVRKQPDKADIFEITFLQSDPFGTSAQSVIAFRKRIAWIGDETILKAAHGNGVANNALGQFILWELDDPTNARPYLEKAVAAGVEGAVFDLAVAVLMKTAIS